MKDQMNTPLEIGEYYVVVKRKYKNRKIAMAGKIVEIRDNLAIFDDVVEQHIEQLENGNVEITKTFLTNKKTRIGSHKTIFWLHKDSIDETYYNKINS
jgi:hypothetical protein